MLTAFFAFLPQVNKCSAAEEKIGVDKMRLTRRFLAWLEKRAIILKLIFILSVLVFVFFELGRIFQQTPWNEIILDLTKVKFRYVILMINAGFIAVLPMLIYDFVMVSFLPQDFSKGYILKSGWITNTFTNLLGFGGIVGATLRANFYSKRSSKTTVLSALSKVALFLLAGLSFCCWLVLLLAVFHVIKYRFIHYLILIIGGALYFPLALSATFFQKHSFLKGLTLKKELLLSFGSILEWLAVSGFLFTDRFFTGH